MRCVSSQSTATALLGSQRGIPIVVGSTVMQNYRPALSLVNNTSNFSERLSTFSYSYQESCNLYPRCALYFSVEHTVSPQSVVSNSSSGCSVEYTIHNLMRCVSYQSTATALLSNQRGKPVILGSTVIQRPSQFTITSVSIGACNDIIKVTKCNTVFTNRSDVTGIIVTEMVTWGTSAVFALRESPPGGKTSAAVNDEGDLISTYHCFLGGTVGYHRDCIRSCYSCVILAELQAETEGLPTKEPLPLLPSLSSSSQRP